RPRPTRPIAGRSCPMPRSSGAASQRDSGSASVCPRPEERRPASRSRRAGNQGWPRRSADSDPSRPLQRTRPGGSLPRGERHDPRDHRERADAPPREMTLREEAGTEYRAQEDADLAGGGDVRDRRDHERGEHQDVREPAHDADRDDLAPPNRPGPTELGGPAKRERRDDKRP